jgi:hypothetical protein
MPEILVWGVSLDGDEGRSLSAGLRRAFPEYEPAYDGSWRTLRIAASPDPYDPEEFRRKLQQDTALTRSGWVADVVVLVLPAVVGATAQAAVEAVVDWLRGLKHEPKEKLVQIYGPNGEPLRMVRLRRQKLEIFDDTPWPLPLTPEELLELD